MSKPVINSTVLADGVAVVVNMGAAPVPMTVAVNPLGDAEITVSYSLDGGVNYKEGPNGAVTAASTAEEKETIFFSGITQLKIQRTAGTDITSTFSAC
jgi:hypothetical protein